MRLDRFYVGKRVIVTGHTGFKGSWLCAWLKRMGASVTGISLAPDPGRPNHFELVGIEEGMTSIIHDIRDGDGVIRVRRFPSPAGFRGAPRRPAATALAPR